ncbi:TetR/AcrR family transcriptional regulator [Rhizobium sp. 2YAF20]|uniref:TetR/AcrR family transcriptional regulator n=1 Tax=Rhizobium sp. 2YAF20 TaxID=3233027 RepID=UPI003F9A439D
MTVAAKLEKKKTQVVERNMNTSVRAKMKTQKQAYVQEEILIVAAKLFAERGFRAVTIDDIATSLGYTKSVIYYYFKNKNEVLWTLFNRIHDASFQDLSEIVASGLPTDKLMSAMIRKHTLNVMERTAWTAIYFRDEAELSDTQQKMVIGRKKKYEDMFRMVYEAGVSEGLFKNVSAHLAISGMIGMTNWIHVWYKPNGKMTTEQIADHYVSVLADGYTLKT